jgi:hypothetical protein
VFIFVLILRAGGCFIIFEMNDKAPCNRKALLKSYCVFFHKGLMLALHYASGDLYVVSLSFG